MRVLCLGHYSGQQFEKGAVSVSESLVSCGLKADSGKKRQKIRGFRNIQIRVEVALAYLVPGKYFDFTRLFLCVPGLGLM